jgi:glycosyltransferase involved in cell wall biosynthesis
MQLSVLTPTYNYGRFLGDAVASVRAQGDAEHVVVDGGSSDETLVVLGRAPSNVVWRSEPDRGQSDALNKALALAHGDWIGWLNADEFYLPGAFDALGRCLAEHPDADLVHGDAVFVDAEGRLLRLVAQHAFSTRVLRWNRCNISSCAMFVRRTAIPERGWDVALRAAMDWDLYLELARRGGRVVYLPRPIGAFRVHPDQVTFQPLPHDHPDFGLLERRHRRPRGWKGVVANRVGELEHRVRKVAEGGFRRELRARAQRGADMRWFRSPAARANAISLLSVTSARTTGDQDEARGRARVPVDDGVEREPDPREQHEGG